MLNLRRRSPTSVNARNQFDGARLSHSKCDYPPLVGKCLPTCRRGAKALGADKRYGKVPRAGRKSPYGKLQSAKPSTERDSSRETPSTELVQNPVSRVGMLAQ